MKLRFYCLLFSFLPGFPVALLFGQDGDPPAGNCCAYATCATCDDINVCMDLPGSSPENSIMGGTAVCGSDHPTSVCSTWWENNTVGVTNGSPVSPTNPGGCLVVCSDPNACNFDEIEECEYLSCAGCTDPNACNYSAIGDCEYLSCAAFGCTDGSRPATTMRTRILKMAVVTSAAFPAARTRRP